MPKWPSTDENETTDERRRTVLLVARQAASRASSDEQVINEAANHALVQFERYEDQIRDDGDAHRKWVRTVATNHARKVGAKLHHDLPMGRQGSIPPAMHDDQADQRVALLISEMHHGGGSLGSFVALKVDFDQRWALLSPDARSLLDDKYVRGLTAKAIAEERGRGESTGAIEKRISAAKKVARLVFDDLLDELQGIHHDDP